MYARISRANTQTRAHSYFVFARECVRVCERNECTPLSPAQTRPHSYFEFARECDRACEGDKYTHSLAHTHNARIPSQTRTHSYFPRKHTHALLSLTNIWISHAHTRVSLAKTHTLTSPANTHTRVFPSLTRTHFCFHRKYAHALLSLAHTLISPAQTQTHSLANMQTHTFSRLVGSLRL